MQQTLHSGTLSFTGVMQESACAAALGDGCDEHFEDFVIVLVFHACKTHFTLLLLMYYDSWFRSITHLIVTVSSVLAETLVHRSSETKRQFIHFSTGLWANHHYLTNSLICNLITNILLSLVLSHFVFRLVFFFRMSRLHQNVSPEQLRRADSFKTEHK